MLIAEEIKNRIIQVAETILSESGKMPTVAEVRSTAQTDMNTTSTVMKEWRQQKLLPEKKIEEEAPKAVQEDALNLASKIWATAKQQAEEKLIKAEVELQREREDAENMRVELSTECDALQGTVKSLQTDLANTRKDLQKLELDKVELQKAEQTALKKAEVAEARNVELEKLVANLKLQMSDLTNQKDQEIKVLKETAEKDAHTRSTLEESLNKAQNLVAEKETTIQIQTTTIKQLEERVAEYKGQVTEYKEKFEVSEKLKAASEKDSVQAKTELQGVKDQLAQAQQNLTKWQGMLEKALKTTETKEKNPSQK